MFYDESVVDKDRDVYDVFVVVLWWLLSPHESPQNFKVTTKPPQNHHKVTTKN